MWRGRWVYLGPYSFEKTKTWKQVLWIRICGVNKSQFRPTCQDGYQNSKDIADKACENNNNDEGPQCVRLALAITDGSFWKKGLNALPTVRSISKSHGQANIICCFYCASPCSDGTALAAVQTRHWSVCLSVCLCVWSTCAERNVKTGLSPMTVSRIPCWEYIPE